MSKDYDHWNNIKQQLDSIKEPPLFKEREIWWCSIGVNVGFEIFGKNDELTRPVLILRKHSHFTFFGLPLASKRKNIPTSYPLSINNREGSILLDQGRTLDSRRLRKRILRLSEDNVEEIRKALHRCL